MDLLICILIHELIEMHDIAMQMVMRWARFGENEAIDATSDFTRLTIDTLAL